jgi:Fe-S-cluster containining protein
MQVSRQRQHRAATAANERAAALRNDCSDRACGDACRALNRELEREIDSLRAAGAAVACAPGCDYCCHQRVSVFRHEARALLAYLREEMPPAEAAAIERRLLDNARRIDGLTVAQHRSANLRCAFLVGGRCSAYSVRPSICASFHSLSKARCEHAFNHPQDSGQPSNARPALLAVEALSAALMTATQAGLEAAGMSDDKLELHQALRALIEARLEVDATVAASER